MLRRLNQLESLRTSRRLPQRISRLLSLHISQRRFPLQHPLQHPQQLVPRATLRDSRLADPRLFPPVLLLAHQLERLLLYHPASLQVSRVADHRASPPLHHRVSRQDSLLRGPLGSLPVDHLSRPQPCRLHLSLPVNHQAPHLRSLLGCRHAHRPGSRLVNLPVLPLGNHGHIPLLHPRRNQRVPRADQAVRR